MGFCHFEEFYSLMKENSDLKNSILSAKGQIIPGEIPGKTDAHKMELSPKNAVMYSDEETESKTGLELVTETLVNTFEIRSENQKSAKNSLGNIEIDTVYRMGRPTVGKNRPTKARKKS